MADVVSIRQVPLDDILDLVACADDYGFSDVLMSAFAEWTGFVTDEQIKQFASGNYSEDPYSEEDYEEIMDRVTRWRNQYTKQP